MDFPEIPLKIRNLDAVWDAEMVQEYARATGDQGIFTDPISRVEYPLVDGGVDETFLLAIVRQGATIQPYKDSEACRALLLEVNEAKTSYNSREDRRKAHFDYMNL